MDIIPINYQLSFEPDLKKFTFTGSETISIDCKKPTKVITMHCAELKILSCQVKSGNEIIQSSPKTVEKDEQLQITLEKKSKGFLP
ncbi:hypothetical protein BD31_I0193 [Candidatus Nitrosopumilus salaria BD31]|uniref:Aminopeptidase N-like N-terminal domain-containing protein n=1 Tax=Candidatus Nitrosopumilus salarius BD31 TaxID=859350 RepID=I3D2P7_9ARCH|nr:hypothetical protein [Candidatus Nitrosopumilus salaria]EIJ65990.1 hypothetical protein BD31_I0193 [Candidatus Nitrosopumilus salaria BD31]